LIIEAKNICKDQLLLSQKPIKIEKLSILNLSSKKMHADSIETYLYWGKIALRRQMSKFVRDKMNYKLISRTFLPK
jgi:hypothetical protein